ncbi:MAG: peptide ABC transporter permease [Candidatus Lambdaproteobacteria bacterium RIFOXYD2_FULL_50_16]|uniref:Peptide ABC transporter permease n=1 Tax=Candidatus Lambdaproteobacteria bacterium RIFOXYD2_FULL_50_16 TaxID=1817772 RepID=A0A1F6GBA2_9PROT|nr:MAG: peptide ABC transporter permease [Candidatus Lambdaproteobacteria bacterium RIFOXYD2_FULL_50_16]
MRQYLIRRFLLLVPTLIGITLLTFMITRVVPGGPIEQMLMERQFSGAEQTGKRSNNNGAREGLSEADLEYLKQLYGFDKPILVAYLDWMGDILRLDLGESYRYNEPVWDLIKARLPVSLYYGLVTSILTYLVCIPLGVLKAVKDKTWIDSVTSILIFTGYAVPAFVLGLILVVFFGGRLEWFPMEGFTGDHFDDLSWGGQVWDVVYHSILPLTCYLIGAFASMTVLMKNSLLENLSTDYVRTAFAKGLPASQVIWKHALRNSLIPLAASFGNNISLVFTGSYLIETVFNIDGLGLLGFQAITERDYPVVLGSLFLTSLIFLLGNILSDLCLAWVDPRIRFS